MENGYYSNGVLNGKYKGFYGTGAIKEEGEYKQGKKICKWFYYDESGNKTKQNYGE